MTGILPPSSPAVGVAGNFSIFVNTAGRQRRVGNCGLFAILPSLSLLGNRASQLPAEIMIDE